MWLWWFVRNNTQCCLHCAFVVRISNFLFVLQLVGLHGGLFAHSVLDLFLPLIYAPVSSDTEAQA